MAAAGLSTRYRSLQLERPKGTPRIIQVGPGVGPAAGALTGQAQGLGRSVAPTFAYQWQCVKANGAVPDFCDASICTGRHVVSLNNPRRSRTGAVRLTQRQRP